MSANTKRLDLRFGSFACSVQGFDDPVMPVQQVLQALQHVLEETPALADAGISLDAETVENLIEEVARRADLAVDDVDIAPGLVIVHRGEGRPATAFDADGQGAEPEAWTRPFTESTAPEQGSPDQRDGDEDSEDAEAAERGPGGYVDLFATPPGSAAMVAADAAAPVGGQEDEDLAGGDVSDLFGEEPDRTAAGAWTPGLDETTSSAGEALRDIFAETDDADDGRIFADAMAPDGSGDTPAGEAAEEAAYGEPDDPFGQSGAAVTGIGGDGDADAGERWASEERGEGGDLAPLNLFAPAGSPDAAGGGGGETLFSELLAERTQSDSEQDGAGEVHALFGDETEHADAEDPEPAEQEEGHTAARLAEAAGAKTVPDLMVAAAAWLVLLRGQSHFTRPEVMDVFDRIPGDHDKSLPSRIRGFGRAVRDGHIVAINDTHYGLATTEFDLFEGLL